MVIHWKWRVVPAYGLMVCAICLIIWCFLHISSKEPVVREEHIVDRALPDGSPKESFSVKAVLPDDIHVMRNDAKKENKQDEVVLKFDGPLIIPNNTVLRSMSWEDLSILYHKYVSQTQYDCKDIDRVGKVTDGGWDVCKDAKYAPPAHCIVYSFGIGYDFSFDDGMILKYGCTVYSFDPSMDMTSVKRNPKSFYFKQGLADSDRTLPNGWAMSRLNTIKTSLKHTKNIIHTIKLDIEEWEWEVLPDLLVDNSLSTVTQLLIELHQCDGCSKYDPSQTDKEPPKERYIHMLELLRQLYELNFRIFHHRHNSACNYLSKFTLEQISACTDLGFVRVS